MRNVTAAIIAEFFLTALIKCEMVQRSPEALAALAEESEEWDREGFQPVDMLVARVQEAVQKFVIESQEKL